MKLIDKNDITGSILKIGFWVAVAGLSIYWLTQEFGPTRVEAVEPVDSAVVNVFVEYPRTPDPIETCPQHAEYIFQVMALRVSGVTKEEVLESERNRWERFNKANPDADPAYWVWTEYAIAEAYKASDEVMTSRETMVQYAIRYFEECVRIKQEEAGS